MILLVKAKICRAYVYTLSGQGEKVLCGINFLISIEYGKISCCATLHRVSGVSYCFSASCYSPHVFVYSQQTEMLTVHYFK